MLLKFVEEKLDKISKHSIIKYCNTIQQFVLQKYKIQEKDLNLDIC